MPPLNKPSGQIERRTYRTVEFRVSADGEPAKIGGYGAVFNSPSEDLGWFEELREEIAPDAFDALLRTNPDVRGLFNHNSDHVLGRTSAGTMRLSVDARGLAYEIDPPDTQFARDLMISMRRKDITGSSFGFIVSRDQWTDNPDGSITRRILEISSLLDVSPVTFPAYPASSAEARGVPVTCPVEMRSRLEAKIASRKPAKRANEDGCECDCAECLAGNCEMCTDVDCNDPNCAAERSLRNADANRRMAIRTAFAVS